MRKIFLAPLLILSIALSLFASGYQNINAKEAYELVKNGALFIDVRTTKEYKRLHPKGAKLVPIYDEVNGKVEPNQNFLKEIEYLANDDYDKPIVIICRSGHRSANAAEILAKAGFGKVYNVIRGFYTRGGWLDYRLPVEK